MQSNALGISTLNGWDAIAGDLADLPDHLRPHAVALLIRFMNAQDEWELSPEEIVSAIMSSSFRPILEQEATLSSLGLAS
ncbi:hypothetical protein F1643_21265 [Azospirillum sp. INR13]|uniref:hypothetical protein n=1 Tax=Azospirillum sp. INR13 TaxID=2596919 RepID=UPI001892503E|nr:hypothetical protein [Azospirillum sp. INR13]MBF5096527.1 hypothetical protein [Azospirillum sp. INR13]